MNREQPLSGGTRLDQPEPGIRYDGKLVRDMTDAEVGRYVQQTALEQQNAQLEMQNAVIQYGVRMAIANVLAFEHERRTKKIRLAVELVS